MMCPDLSDKRICRLTLCKSRRADYFLCANNEFCIPNELVCDGHSQCDDGSDESFCSVCPPTNITLKKELIFSCKHRYTGKPICANPCDGRDDLCEEFIDENCSGPKFIPFIFGLSVVLLLVGLLDYLARRHLLALTDNIEKNPTGLEYNVYMADINKKQDDFQTYLEMREEYEFGPAMSNVLLFFKTTGELFGANEFSHHYYKQELKFNKGSTKKADLFFFRVLGTGEAVEYLYDILDDGLGVKMYKRIIYNFPICLINALGNITSGRAWIMVKLLSRVLLHYSDIIKDIILLSQLFMLMFDSKMVTLFARHSKFPAIVLWVVLASIVASELSIVMSLTSYNTSTKISKEQNVFSVILAPFMPAVIHYQESKLKI
jgi:hypothetical protein